MFIPPRASGADKTARPSAPSRGASRSARTVCPEVHNVASRSTTAPAPWLSHHRRIPPRNGGNPIPRISPMSTSAGSRTIPSSSTRVASSSMGRNSRSVISSSRQRFLGCLVLGDDREDGRVGLRLRPFAIADPELHGPMTCRHGARLEHFLEDRRRRRSIGIGVGDHFAGKDRPFAGRPCRST